MKHVVFIIGPALGHVSRSLIIARELAKLAHNKISFLMVTPGYGEKLLLSEFPFEKIVYKERGDVLFADGIEMAVKKINPDMICIDMTPMPWLKFVRFPKIPIVYITNYFLTNICEYLTCQQILFEHQKCQLNSIRKLRGLSEIKNIKDLYELGHVILCDPLEIVNITNKLPDNYHIVGPCLWESEIDLPEELNDLDDILFISLGSTGVKPIPQLYINEIVSELGIKDVVWLGSNLTKVNNNNNYTNHYYKWLPLSQMINRSKFVISQGGAGSTYHTLANGVACGVWPSHQNHTVMGLIVQNYGCGILINDSSIVLRNLHILFESLNDRSKFLANSLKSINGPFNAAKKLIELLDN